MTSELQKRRLNIAKRMRGGKRLASLPITTSKHLYSISRRSYFSKMRGGHPSPPRATFLYILATWSCTVLAISLLYALSSYTDSLITMAPFGATCVLLFAAPESHFSQPRNVIGGHFIAATISVLLWHFLGDQWWVLALGVGTAIAVMQLTKTLHPPAGAHPLVIITGHASWGFIFTPVLLGAITLVLCGIIANNLIKDRHYPRYWW